VAGFREHGYGFLGPVNGGDLPDQLRACQFLKKDFAPWS